MEAGFILLILSTLVMLHSLNSLITMSRINSVMNKLWEIHSYGKVSEVYEYHSPYRLSNWLGFRHWFYPYEVKR